MDGFAPLAETALRDIPVADSVADSLADSVADPLVGPVPVASDGFTGLAARLRPWRAFLAFVVAPTAVAAIYFGLVATPQYQSEAHFLVRSGAVAPSGASGLGTLLGLGASNGGQSEGKAVEDYLLSHDAVAALRRSVDLVGVFRQPGVDPLSRLQGGERPPAETLLKYYRRHVRVTVASDTGIASLMVRAFRPRDAQLIAETLLRLGEARVNTFNQRGLEDGISVARAQLKEAEEAVARSEGSVTRFRQGQSDIDPEHSSLAAISLSSGLEQQLAGEKARLAGMSASVASDSPQRVAQQARVNALSAQVGGARARMAGPRTAMAPQLGVYEGLRLRQQFAAKRYESAASALDAARTEALRQQLFVVRVVEPNLPGKALYPERIKTIGTVLLLLLLVYGVGWLVVAGVREHAA